MTKPSGEANGPGDRAEQAGARSAEVRLSCRELAAKLGISYDAARIKANRRWKVEFGNDGEAHLAHERQVNIKLRELRRPWRVRWWPRAAEQRGTAERDDPPGQVTG